MAKRSWNFRTVFAIYIATEIIGDGGAGRVFKAEDDSGNKWAIKLLDSSKASKDKVKRFKNEYHFCSRNQHENILTIHDYGLFYERDDFAPFYVMPLYSGSLRDLMNGGIGHAKILPYFSQIIDGVEAAHLKGVIHRDLKPENILYDRSNDKLIVADFGIARFSAEELLTLIETSPNQRLANFQYSSPEQRIRNKVVDHRSDIYALGLILNEMFTGELPHGTEYKTIGSVSEPHAFLDPIVQIMLRQSPEERYSSIEELKRELIGKSREFITRQKISKLNNTVIPTTDLDDPLVIDPPKLIDFDWNNNNLTLVLSYPVNELWVWSLKNMGNHTSVMGKGPETFQFNGAEARVLSTAHDVQRIIDYFKDWLPKANQKYKETVQKQKRDMENAERESIKRELERQELRKKILSEVKI